MTIDVGLTAGICALWQQEALFDYIIQVGDYEIPVHRAIMASVSDYFRVMLNGPLLESTTNRVELKGQSVLAVSKLIELVYTGNENIVNNSAMEIFGPAVYFQMTYVIEACVDSIIESLSHENCWDLLALFAKYSCEDGIEGVKAFLKTSYKSAVEYCKYEELLYEAVKVISECWWKNEWDLFLFLKHWVTVDYEKRKPQVNNLMSQVRFCLIDQENLEAILEMDMFTSSEEPWCELVRRAVIYQNEPIHHKILETSAQAKTRGRAVRMVFNTDEGEARTLHVFGKGGKWVLHQTLNPPKVQRYQSIEACLEINNFLIICSEYDGQLNWNVFDPRTMKWSQLVKKAPRTGFASFLYDEKLYTLGGIPELERNVRVNIASVTRSVEEYSFRTNTWQEVNRMPRPVMDHAVCVYDDSVYVSGGWRGELCGCNARPSDDVDCLDMTTGTWEKKAPMPNALMNHKMHVMTLNSERVIVIIDNETDPDTRYECHISYYQPATDQWTEYDPSFTPRVPYDIKWVSPLMLAQGNTVFFINIEQGNENDDGWMDNIHPDNIPGEEACVQWRFSQTRENISEVNYPKYPSHGYGHFGAILAL